MHLCVGKSKPHPFRRQKNMSPRHLQVFQVLLRHFDAKATMPFDKIPFHVLGSRNLVLMYTESADVFLCTCVVISYFLYFSIYKATMPFSLPGLQEFCYYTVHASVFFGICVFFYGWKVVCFLVSLTHYRMKDGLSIPILKKCNNNVLHGNSADCCDFYDFHHLHPQAVH